jgi:hypothetical protein
VEFKRELPANDRDSKRTVLKTVAAFATGAGGTVVFGIDDATAELVGLDTPSMAVERQRDRLVDMIRACIDPGPSYDLQLAEVNGKTLLVLQVHSGERGAHALFPQNPEFYVRRPTRREHLLGKSAGGRGCVPAVKARGDREFTLGVMAVTRSSTDAIGLPPSPVCRMPMTRDSRAASTTSFVTMLSGLISRMCSIWATGRLVSRKLLLVIMAMASAVVKSAGLSQPRCGHWQVSTKACSGGAMIVPLAIRRLDQVLNALGRQEGSARTRKKRAEDGQTSL